VSPKQIVANGPAPHMAIVDGYAIVVPDGFPVGGRPVEVELADIGRSVAKGSLVPHAERRRRK
jgi:hypothetical protein